MLIDETESRAFDETVAKAKQLARAGDGTAAIALADEVIHRYPLKIEGWMVRGLVHELGDEYELAARDITRAIELNSLEPHLYYSRGRYFFYLGDDHRAADDFSQGLRLSEFHKNDYYREELLFWRAEAFLRLGRKKEALEDLANVSDDFTSWTYKLRTKQDLLRDGGLKSGGLGGSSGASRVASSQ